MQKSYNVSMLNVEELKALFGPNDTFLKLLEKYFDAVLTYHDGNILIENGQETRNIIRALDTMVDEITLKRNLSEQDIIYIAHLAKNNNQHLFKEFKTNPLGKTYDGKYLSPKTLGQKLFVDAMKKEDIVFTIGPAGTGKTYLAVVYATSLLKKGVIKRIILTRPAVEAGESLGFLPGDLKEKVDPYLQPLYDALNEMLGVEQVERYLEKKIIEIAPLAYMRGRTLSDSFIILDEAQNATKTQIKMALTRIGYNSKMVINGDITQIDLRSKVTSGLKATANLLKSIDGITLVTLTSKDVVRHPLVQKIIDAYEAAESDDNGDIIS